MSADYFDEAGSLRTQNPLGKVATLLLADGTALYDSCVILKYFDHLAGRCPGFGATAPR